MDELNKGLASLVRFGVSDHLLQDLQAIEDSVDHNSQPLYEHAAVYEMRCAILCRNYAKTLWEYSHYIALIEHESEQGVIEFFWEQATLSSARFRHWMLEVADRSSILSEEQGVFTGRMGQRRFSFNPKRINLMAAWTAFLVLVEPGILEKLATFRQALREKSLDEFARYLKKVLDRYLEPHLQAIHQQRQGRLLLSWLQNEADTAEASLLSDARIIAFWQHNAESEEGDFKRFVTVADCAYRLHEAIALSEDQQQLAAARSYHQDQQGEDATWLIDEVSQLNDNDTLFANLLVRERVRSVENLAAAPLKDIKFLTAKDAAYCEKFELAGSALQALPLTFLRAQIYGLQQARITEDIRASKGQHLESLIALAGLTSLPVWYAGVNEQIQRIRQTRAAVTHILYKHAHPLALARILESLNEEQKTQLSDLLESQPVKGIIDQVYARLPSIAPVALKQLEAAFGKLNRAGFKSLPDAAQLESYLAGDVQLAALEAMIGEYVRHLAKSVKRHGDMASLEAEDARIFTQTFARLYGEAGDRR